MTFLLDLKLLFGLISVLFTFFSYLIYIKSIFKGRTKPHIFSWLIWGIISLIICIIQIGENAGIGALNTGFVALLCLGIGVVSIKKGEKKISMQDRLSFVLGLISISLWMVTDNLILSVVFLIVIDIFGFIPTFLKSYKKPFEENIEAYFLASLGYVFSLFATSDISFLSSGFIFVTFILNMSLVALIVGRRYSLGDSIA